MRKVEVCFSPELYDSYHDETAIVVAIDVFRATSAMCAAFEHGVSAMLPVMNVDEAKAYQKKGYLVAAERQGKRVEGFDIGNSPFDYMSDKTKNKEVVITTTNGTKAIVIGSKAHEVIVGSFLNITAVEKYLLASDRNVMLLCAGWRGRFNLEDSLFAGELVERLHRSNQFDELSDSAIAARHFHLEAEGNIEAYLEKSSHRRRLANLNLEKDIAFCLQKDYTAKVPKLQEDKFLRE